MIDLYRIKEDFSVLVKEAEPWTLTQFVMWLDLKLSEYKIKGYMVLDHHTKTKPKWIVEEDNTSDVAPVTFRQNKKPTNDGNFYSDLQASPISHRTSSREQHQPMDDSDAVRGGVGIIDLSHAENNRRNNTSNISNMSRPRHAEISLSKNYQSSAFQEKSSNAIIERDKSRKDEIIEIDTSSPTEKMFVTSNKTSTPVQHIHPESRSVQKPKNRPALSMGTAIYTTTSSTTTPTFSTSYISPQSRSTVPSFSNRKYALGAPPMPVTMPSNISSLDEMIAQAVQYNEINTDNSSQSHARQIPSHTEVQQQQPKISDIEKHPVQTSFTKQHPVQTSLSEQSNVFQQTSTQSSAVPVALHANIDNINRDISQSSTHSSSEGLEIKIEAEVDNSISDSFFIGDNTEQTSDIQSQSHDTSYPEPAAVSFTSEGMPKQGLVDPETARAYSMVELINGSGVYVYERTIAQAFKIGTEHQTGTYSGEKMARFLLNVFWSRKELVGATLSKAGRGKKILNQQIIEAILGSFGEDPESPDVSDGFGTEKEDPSYMPQGPGCPPLSRYGGSKEIELPTFEDPLVRRALEDNKPPSRHTWSKIITRCAYHLLSKGVPRKHDYQMFAESFYRRYPCVGTSRGPNPWSQFSGYVSQKVRNLRKKYRHVLDQDNKFNRILSENENESYDVMPTYPIIKKWNSD